MKRLVAAVLLAAFPLVVRGEGMVFIPRWHMTGSEACYDLAGAKQLVLADLELQRCEQRKAHTGELILVQEQLTLAFDREKQRADLAVATADSYQHHLESCIDDRAKLAAKVHSGPSVGWLVAGGLAVTLVGVVAGAYLIR